MRKIVIGLLLLVSSSAFAVKMKKIAMMATESVVEHLSLNDGDHYYKINNQSLVNPEENAQVAVSTELSVWSIHSGRVKNLTCSTQFIKASEFFEVSKTECKTLQ